MRQRRQHIHIWYGGFLRAIHRVYNIIKGLGSLWRNVALSKEDQSECMEKYFSKYKGNILPEAREDAKWPNARMALTLAPHLQYLPKPPPEGSSSYCSSSSYSRIYPPPYPHYCDNSEGRIRWEPVVIIKENLPPEAHGDTKWRDAHVALTLVGKKLEVGGGVMGLLWLGGVTHSWNLVSIPLVLSPKVRNWNCEKVCKIKSIRRSLVEVVEGGFPRISAQGYVIIS